MQTDGFDTEHFPHRSLTHRRLYGEHFLIFTEVFINRCLYMETNGPKKLVHNTLLSTTNHNQVFAQRPFLCLSWSPTFRVPLSSIRINGRHTWFKLGNFACSFHQLDKSNISNIMRVLYADAFLVQIVYPGPGNWDQGRAFFCKSFFTVGWNCLHRPVIVRVVGHCWARMPGPYGSQRLRQDNFATL